MGVWESEGRHLRSGQSEVRDQRSEVPCVLSWLPPAEDQPTAENTPSLLILLSGQKIFHLLENAVSIACASVLLFSHFQVR